jgi:type IV pilus assembly protein PilV
MLAGTVTVGAMSASKARQEGIALLEGLIAILIFSVGILALVALQAASVKHSANAKYRTTAALVANKIISRMWVRPTAEWSSFNHNPTGAVCSPDSAPSTNAQVLEWLARDVRGELTSGATDAVRGLPNATADRQQVQVSAGGTITVTVCWQLPGEPAPHSHTTTAQVQRN